MSKGIICTLAKCMFGDEINLVAFVRTLTSYVCVIPDHLTKMITFLTALF